MIIPPSNMVRAFFSPINIVVCSHLKPSEAICACLGGCLCRSKALAGLPMVSGGDDIIELQLSPDRIKCN
jgi:hypothetical protein